MHPRLEPEEAQCVAWRAPPACDSTLFNGTCSESWKMSAKNLECTLGAPDPSRRAEALTPGFTCALVNTAVPRGRSMGAARRASPAFDIRKRSVCQYWRWLGETIIEEARHAS